MIRIDDEQLEYYADRFVLLRLNRHGVNLEQYLANVDRFERLALEPEPLLPAQQTAALRLWQQQDTGVLPRQHAAPTHGPWIDPADIVDIGELLAGLRAEVEATEQMPRQNGAAIEPMRHHRHNRRNNGDFSKRGA
ncbi:hypothetical protein QO259_09915 [Salinicola sp. JS01]|uniref:hypothetical protein n=1 Tax=Salinicola sp. JS01 TaxID=3050071 RepID=UPI00255B822D|nr:hypothetical protein [Salinicola sp. JS01]WIX34928.1 hypothetical protein QO259_09915 [Salinicola sp. JS01]